MTQHGYSQYRRHLKLLKRQQALDHQIASTSAVTVNCLPTAAHIRNKRRIRRYQELASKLQPTGDNKPTNHEQFKRLRSGNAYHPNHYPVLVQPAVTFREKFNRPSRRQPAVRHYNTTYLEKLDFIDRLPPFMDPLNTFIKKFHRLD